MRRSGRVFAPDTSRRCSVVSEPARVDFRTEGMAARHWHLGRGPTHELLAALKWWPGMRADVGVYWAIHVTCNKERGRMAVSVQAMSRAMCSHPQALEFNALLNTASAGHRGGSRAGPWVGSRRAGSAPCFGRVRGACARWLGAGTGSMPFPVG